MGLVVRIVAGAPTAFIEETDGFIIAVDKGVKHCLDQNIKFDLAVGDFDSFPEEEVMSTKVVLDSIKDETDLFVAIQHAIKMKPERVYVYGGTNGRADHYLANVNLLGLYDIVLIDDVNKIYVKDSSFDINTEKYVSFFHFDGKPVISLKGFKYPLTNYSLEPRDNLCVSNEVTNNGFVELNGGRILVIESKRD